RTQRADLAEQRALSHRLDRRHKTHLPDEKISSIALMCRWRYSPDPCNFLLAQVPARQGISSDHPGGAAAGPWETALLLRSVFGYTGWEAEDGRRRRTCRGVSLACRRFLRVSAAAGRHRLSLRFAVQHVPGVHRRRLSRLPQLGRG